MKQPKRILVLSSSEYRQMLYGVIHFRNKRKTSHMEMVAQPINLLNGYDVDVKKVSSGEIQSHVILGLNPGLINASGLLLDC